MNNPETQAEVAIEEYITFEEITKPRTIQANIGGTSTFEINRAESVGSPFRQVPPYINLVTHSALTADAGFVRTPPVSQKRQFTDAEFAQEAKVRGFVSLYAYLKVSDVSLAALGISGLVSNWIAEALWFSTHLLLYVSLFVVQHLP